MKLLGGGLNHSLNRDRNHISGTACQTLRSKASPGCITQKAGYRHIPLRTNPWKIVNLRLERYFRNKDSMHEDLNLKEKGFLAVLLSP